MPAPLIDKVRLTELWSKGIPVPQIAKMMGAKADTIYKCAHRIGLYKRKGGPVPILSDPEKRKWFIRNYPEMSNSTIGVYLELSEDHVGKLARRLGLRKSDAYWQGIREYHKKRMRQFHDTKKGDKEYYAYNIRPRKNGKFIKMNEA